MGPSSSAEWISMLPALLSTTVYCCPLLFATVYYCLSDMVCVTFAGGTASHPAEAHEGGCGEPA